MAQSGAHGNRSVGTYVATALLMANRRLARKRPGSNSGRSSIPFKSGILKIMKVACLALGMLSCMKRGFDLLAEINRDLATIPTEDPRTYTQR